MIITLIRDVTCLLACVTCYECFDHDILVISCHISLKLLQLPYHCTLHQTRHVQLIFQIGFYSLAGQQVKWMKLRPHTIWGIIRPGDSLNNWSVSVSETFLQQSCLYIYIHEAVFSGNGIIAQLLETYIQYIAITILNQ